MIVFMVPSPWCYGNCSFMYFYAVFLWHNSDLFLRTLLASGFSTEVKVEKISLVFSSDVMLLSCKQLWAGLWSPYFNVFENAEAAINAIERFGNHE